MKNFHLKLKKNRIKIIKAISKATKKHMKILQKC